MTSCFNRLVRRTRVAQTSNNSHKKDTAMRRPREYRAALVLAAAVAGASLLSGFTSRVPVYDGGNREHRWDAREGAAYRRYLADQHLQYRDFTSLSAKDQSTYWDWRERHPG
jgi:hypothetical protein